MIVRILNKKTDTDKLFDCRNSCLQKQVGPEGEEYCLIVESGSNSIEIVLASRDEIYYMNDSGKTVHADYVMLDK